MQKTIIICVSIVCVTIIISVGIISHHNSKYKYIENGLKDKTGFTHCFATVMSEARQSGKPIDAKEATELCKTMQG